MGEGRRVKSVIFEGLAAIIQDFITGLALIKGLSVVRRCVREHPYFQSHFKSPLSTASHKDRCRSNYAVCSYAASRITY